MIIDNFTIIIGAAILLIGIVTPWINVLVRRPKPRSTDDDRQTSNDDESTQDGSSVKDKLPPISVILTPHENAYELEENLPLFLEQDYPGEFTIIVVTWKSDSESDDVLKRYASNPHLYATYIPDSSRYMSRKKLAITLGVKAAKTEWVLMTEATNKPDTDKWLATMARNTHDGNNLVIGYTRYDESTSGYRRFERLAAGFRLMRETQKGRTYRCDSTCLMFRKSEFIASEGFRGNLKYLRGEYDFMANKYARPLSVALETAPEAWMTEQEPTDKEWRNRHLFYMEDRKHLARGTRHRICAAADQAALHANYAAIIATGAIGLILPDRWLITAAAALSLIITLATRTAIASAAFRQWHTDIAAWRVPFYEVSYVWRAVGYRIRYARADKNDFISHKL